MRRPARKPPAVSDGVHSEKKGPTPVTRKSKVSKPFKLSGWSLIVLLAATAVLASAYFLLFPADPSSRSMADTVTPLPYPKMKDLPQFLGTYAEQMLWGTYRPHLYFGIRMRRPKSLLMGAMWVIRAGSGFELRHTCEQSHRLDRYGWLAHDGRTYGRQEIRDGALSLDVVFLKSVLDGSGFGGDWTAVINGSSDSSLSAEGDEKVGLIFYVMDERGDILNLRPVVGEAATGGDIRGARVSGSFPEIGDWQLWITHAESVEASTLGRFTRHSHNLSQLVEKHLTESMQLRPSDSQESKSNIFFYQILAPPPLRLQINFFSGDSATIPARLDSLSGGQLASRLEKAEADFNLKFDRTFQTAAKEGSFQEGARVGKAALSNLIGGMGYFFGQSKVSVPVASKDGATHAKELSYWPEQLFTAVPSRSFFPRGFLWDEGFHQLIIHQWDYAMSLDALSHWLDLLNVDGWIPREQILGAEARSKVGDEFVTQHVSNANPPTLFLLLQSMAHRLALGQGSKRQLDDERKFLERAFPRLQAWFHWFNSTQIGNLPGSYFWHGRDNSTDRELNPKTLMSGLDDYPRSSHPSNDERHLDLRCWILLSSQSMAAISQALGRQQQQQKYRETAARLADISELNKLHLDSKSGKYFDFGNHSQRIQLLRREYVDPTNNWLMVETIRRTVKAPTLRLVPHFGYNSLFPFLMKIFPPDYEGLDTQLNLIRNESLLWTNFGLRSLAKTSKLYQKRNTEHDPPYWRGAIWININYMALGALQHYSQVGGPYQSKAEGIYKELRQNVARNIIQQYEKSGYLWEQYDDKEGVGKGSHPFTGWTALVVLILGEIY